MRIALGLQYDGSHFHGWQSQPELRTVQQELENALSKIADHDVKIQCAGRTDTGVHACEQIVHFDTDSTRGIRAWIYGVNSFLPKDMCVRWAKETSDEFHARYSATSREYQYVIYNHAVRPSIFNSYMTWQYRPLDQHRMHAAAQLLLGEHDFTSFRAIACQSKSPVRCIESFNVERQGDLVIITVKANAFLHHMVRNLAGVLMLIGSEKNEVQWAREVLDAKDRRLGAQTAPPYGLYLLKANYPNHFNLQTPTYRPFKISVEESVDELVR